MSFDSKLVRLKVQIAVANEAAEVVFRFQTGAIKRYNRHYISLIEMFVITPRSEV